MAVSETLSITKVSQDTTNYCYVLNNFNLIHNILPISYRVLHAARVCVARSVNSSCGIDAAKFIDKVLSFSWESALAVYVPTCNVHGTVS